MIQFLTRGHIFRSCIVNRCFPEFEKKKLNIGCSPRTILGYLNTDVDRTGEIYLDAESSHPFSSNSFDVVFSGYMIEHISEDAGQQLLNEIYRILKASGTAILPRQISSVFQN
ncbi:class I SAM-dependent methyltransferase [Haloarcula marismortui]|uniref:class I SAM-dependent methyltransferase n=1 Tax=Haloarcula marismortui TaxID=2238 RepID=UPI003C771199